MIAHVSLQVSNFNKSKDFYTKVLSTVGYKPHYELDDACGYMEGNDTSFWVVESEKIVPTHIAFEAKDKGSVEEFYSCAIFEGARDNGAPGYREQYWPGYYAAFIHDPDGHNIEAVWYDYEKAKEVKE